MLMDHIIIDIDWDEELAFSPVAKNPSLSVGEGEMSVPIEGRLMSLAVGILYEVCRVQKFDVVGLREYRRL
jgi:hypothetical protein